MITYILQVTLCLAFFYALYYAVLQKETLFRTNRIYLLSTLIASLALPLIRIYILDHQQEVSIGTAPIYVGAYLENMNEIIVAPRQHAFPWLGVLTALYKGVVIFLVCRILESVLSIFRMQSVGEKIFLYGQKCVLSPAVRSPFSFFNTIYLPKDHQFSESELEEIITHEKTHVQGRHTLDVLFVELICCALWPSPMVYLYRKKLRELHEFLADAEVLKNTPWENYASFLIAQKNEGLQQRLSNQLIYSQLKNRLVMMNKQRSFQSAKYKYLAIIPILLMALVIFSFREKSDDQKNTESSKSQTYNIYEDGLKIYTFSQPIILTITDDKKYFLNDMEVTFAQLEEAIKEVTSNQTNPTVTLRMGKMVTVGDLTNVMSLGASQNIRFVLETPDQIKYNIKDTFPETVISAYRLREPAADDNGSTENKVEEPYTYVEEMPSFPDGTEAMYKYIYEQIKYPQLARKNGISGQVIVQYVVSKEGDIQKAKVLRGIGGGCNEEALRVVNSMPRWKPGKRLGMFVPVTFTLPVKFVLQENEIKQDEKIPKDEVYTFVEEMPHFPGSTEDMFKYIYQSIKYPEEDRAKGNQGQVIVQFIVETDGSISNAKVVRGISPGLNDEALRVINSMNDLPEKWTPGRHEGKNVPVTFTLPFKFVLQENQKQVIKKDEAVSDNWRSIPETELPLFTMSPSPADDILKVEFSKEVYSAMVIGSSGPVLSISLKSLKESDYKQIIDVSKWIPGQYTIQAFTQTITRAKLFVIQHD